MTKHRSVLLGVAIAVLVASSPAGGQERSWKGEPVMPTKRAKEITFGDYVDGKQVYFQFANLVRFIVRDDREGWIRIHDGWHEGWADKSQFVLVRDAPAYFHRRVQANPKDTWALFMRGVGWLEKGEPDNAIKDFDEYIRLDPTESAAFIIRGNARRAKKEYDKAIKDFDEAIRLGPRTILLAILAFNNRGAAWYSKKEYDKAIKDYGEAIRLDPSYTLPVINRGAARYAKKEYDKAIKGFDEVVRLDPNEARAGILGHFAARRKGDAATAARFLNDTAANLHDAWPYPILQFLRGKIDEPALIKLATDDDKRTRARCYLGLDHALNGRTEEAIAHFRWVTEHGTAGCIEYPLALLELERLERGEK